MNSLSRCVIKTRFTETIRYFSSGGGRSKDFFNQSRNENQKQVEEEEDNQLSIEIMNRIKNIRNSSPNIRSTEDSDVYSSERKTNNGKQEVNTIRINGRDVKLDIPRDQVEVVSSKDY
ncbi:hypothetical protein DLAC_03213 [Tieghemostelium lacteum]|uniref:Uncharacterized protein n=1 Tax=Tieghemostelium lacteum TaxID=361077 RepID=A0A152A1R9_TIELA|nr:hypothetical protein DLAC_03213 [Tieghemostelium lacteum]|eukprot:KYR00067.1 hypothetical protein DLAC_03213 [Tieghemostelium lacteum]